MLKKILLLAAVLISTNVFSEVVYFECKSDKNEIGHHFEAKGVAVIDEDKNVDGIITVKTTKSCEDDSMQVFEQLRVTGEYKVFEKGVLTDRPIEQLLLFPRNNYIRSISAILDTNLNMISTTLTIDNFLFKSNCYKTAN